LAFDPVRIHAPLPDLEIYDAVIDFGAVSIDGEVEGQFDVAAVGEADVRMVVLSTDPDHFAADDLVIELDAGTSSTRKVRFSPSEARAYLAVLALESNDPDAPKQMVLLKGEGIGDADTPLAGIDTASGCGCHTAGAQPPNHGWLLALALALLPIRRAATKRRS
jgi:MYXO-CTERM domain-containing protein